MGTGPAVGHQARSPRAFPPSTLRCRSRNDGGGPVRATNGQDPVARAMGTPTGERTPWESSLRLADAKHLSVGADPHGHSSERWRLLLRDCLRRPRGKIPTIESRSTTANLPSSTAMLANAVAKDVRQQRLRHPQADNRNDQRFELVAQSPDQIKFPNKPRKPKPRPRRSKAEQRVLPGVPASDNESKE